MARNTTDFAQHNTERAVQATNWMRTIAEATNWMRTIAEQNLNQSQPEQGGFGGFANVYPECPS
jgi:hypothetical protein